MNQLQFPKEYKRSKGKKWLVIFLLLMLVCILSFICLFSGNITLTFTECLHALFHKGNDVASIVIWDIRIPRVLAAILAGAGLSLAGLMMQTTLGNVMASPSTLGVSNAAVFGANLSIIALSGGFLYIGNNVENMGNIISPFATSLIAFLFSFVSVVLILLLCKVKNYSPNSVVLAGIAIGSIWTALTTLLQFYATDVGLSAAVVWNFGDLGRANYKVDAIMAVVILFCSIYFYLHAWHYNALLSGDSTAKSIGVKVNLLRFITLLLSSIITAVCVSFLGIIGFVGIICPHVMKRLLGQDHRYLIPASLLCGSLLLLISDTIARGIGNGTSLPVGAITSLLGAPFFLYIIFTRKEGGKA